MMISFTLIFAVVVVAVLILASFWLIWIYNRFIKHENLVEEAWSGIDVQLKRRRDLIPNLLESVKGYASHEKSAFEEITRLRNESSRETDIGQIMVKEAGLAKSLGRIFAIAEDYPDLKASENFISLHENLSEIEDNLQHARRYYNGTVRDYNTLIESFPNNLFASVLKLEQKQFFNIEDASERNIVKVSF